jgi:hypothetical protein
MRHEDDAPFDLRDFAIDPASISIPKAAKARAKTKKWERQYVRMPWFWVERLRRTKRIVTHQLAYFVVYEFWKNGGRPIVLSNLIAAAEGIAPRSKTNALADLKSVGLIKLERRPRRSPRVKVLHVKVD